MSEIRPTLDSERECPVCGKNFWVHDAAWSYKQYVKALKCTVYFCSWKCIRKWEKEKLELQGHGERKSNRQRVIQMLGDGLNMKEIAVLLDISPETVRYYMRGIKREENKHEQQTSAEGSSETH